MKTMSYVGSPVGTTSEVDKSTLHRTDYVRIKIATRDVSKIPETTEGTIIPFLYDFTDEREVEMKPKADGNTIKVPDGKGKE
jgi:hypothetical protein